MASRLPSLRWAGAALVLFAGLGFSPAQTFRLVGELDPFLGANRYGDLWADGRHAYLGSFNGTGVGIIDLSNPAAPFLAAHYNPASNAQFKQVRVRDGLGYFASDDGGGLHIVNLANPSAPVLLSRFTAAGGGFDSIHTLQQVGNLIYEADSRTRTVKVVDVSNPAAPYLVRDIVATDPHFIHDTHITANRLFTSGFGGVTDIYDVANIAAAPPALLGTINSGEHSHSAWANAGATLLATATETANGDVKLYDVADPANPVLRATITAASLGISAYTPHNPVIVGQLLFVAWYQAGLVVLDISNPAAPVLKGTYDTFPGASGFYDGNWGVFPFLGPEKILLSDLQRGLLIVDLTQGTGITDTDSDGLPDTWELYYNLNPASAADADADSDGDGATNRQEYLAGTHPRDAGSVLRLAPPQPGGTDVAVSFSTVTGRTYRVERKETAGPGPWMTLADNLPGDGAAVQITDSGAATNRARFYRVEARR